jgi:Fe-S cluster assembly iron-binding protein IscA
VKYGIALDVKTPKPGDFETRSQGIRIVAEGRGLQHLVGRVIEYMEGPTSNGFMVTEPDAG